MTTHVQEALGKDEKVRTFFWKVCGTCITTWIPQVIGFLFLYAGAVKLVKPGDMMIVATFLRFPADLRTAFIISVALIEVWLGLALLIAPERRSSRWSAIACLTVFIWYLVYLVQLANPPSCGCGGLLALFNSNRANAQFGLFRNVLFVCALLLPETRMIDCTLAKLNLPKTTK